jgi:serine/threonine protein phosphatase 1
MKFSAPLASPARLPPGKRVYAVGDVHGHAVRLHAVLAAVKADARGHADATVVLLGDLVDRGPDSAGTIALARSRLPDLRMVTLMGNHESMMLDALADGRTAAGLWLENGGVETLRSYGVPLGTRPRDWVRAVPAEDQAFMASLPLYWQAGETLFVHAGIRPGLPLQRQSRHDLLWIREPFLEWAGTLPFTVVHGHTPTERVEVRQHRIGLDTGAAWGRPLSCVALEDGTMRVLQIG